MSMAGSRGPICLALAITAGMLLALLTATLAQAKVRIQSVTSDKGVTAWLVEDYSLPIITISFSFTGGSSADPEGKVGAANLLAWLLDEGAGDLMADEFQTAIDDSGAELSFSAGHSSIGGTVRMLADAKDEVVGLLALALQRPRFDAEAVERMRERIVARIEEGANDPDAQAVILFDRALYGDHLYGRAETGTLESVPRITADDLRTIHRDTFARSSVTIGVVGAIDSEGLKNALDRMFGELPERALQKTVPVVAARLGQAIHHAADTEQTTIKLVFPAPFYGDRDFWALYMANHILGIEPDRARLTAELREKRGLVYDVHSIVNDRWRTSDVVVETSTDAENASEVLRLLRREIDRLAKAGVTDEELARSKKFLIGVYPITLETSEALADALVDFQVEDRGLDYFERRPAIFNALTRDEVNAAAAKYFAVEPAILIVGPAMEEPSRRPVIQGASVQ